MNLNKFNSNISLLVIGFANLFFVSIFFSSQAFALDAAALKDLVKTIDEKQRNSGDYQSNVLIEQKEKDKANRVFEANVYRRDADDKWMILFLKPKAESGKGYLRVEKNLFLYEPALGKWERQTERASIAGTGSRRQDFDESRLSEEYDAEFVGEEKLGKFPVWHIKLKAKPGVEVSSPILRLWVDKDAKNILKQQELALSEKLLRTSYYPNWEKKFSKSKNADVYVPKEIYVNDEIEKGNKTTIVLRDVKLDSLPENMFTKAWLEAQSK